MPAQWPSPGVLTAPSTGIARSRCRTFAASARRSLSPRCTCGATATPPYSKRVARGCGRYVSDEYRFETLHGSHWMLDEQPDAVADLLLEWLAAHHVLTSPHFV